MVFVILVTFLTAFVGVLSYFLYHWTFWIRRGVPGPRGFPVIGICNITYNGDYPPFLRIKEWGKKYGPIFGFTEGIKKTLVISDPDLVQEVFVKQFDNFYGRKLNAVHGDPEKDKRVSLFAAQGYKWKRLRTISSPTFSNNSLRKVTSTIEECALELLRHIEEKTVGGEQIDMLQFYQEFTLDVIGRIAMGQPDSQMFKNPLFPHVRSIFGESRQKIFMIGAISPIMIDIMKWFIRNVLPKKQNESSVIWSTVEEAVRRRMEERADPDRLYPEEPQDFIDLFLDAKSDEMLDSIGNEGYSIRNHKISKTLTTDETIAQCTVFIIAGFDTTALSLSFTTYLLATHPGIQKKLQEEVDRECPDPEISFDQLSKLKFMECVMKETLRLYPLAAPANSRTCMKDTVIVDGIRIEKGVHVVANTWAIHTNPKIWGADAGEFKPERWLTNTDHFLQKGGYLPFGLGPRQCIGMRLAYMEEKLLLAHILRKYTFETGAKTVIPMKLVGRATTQPTSVWMHLRPRE
ncbi:unnamed protein product [Caenorhabditis brenneri]